MENKENTGTPKNGRFTSENAREMQLRGVAVKKENRDRRLALENILAESCKVMREGSVIERAKGTQMMRTLVEMALDKNLDAIKLILKVTGELTDKTDITSGGKALNIVVENEATKKMIEELGNE